MNWITKIFKPKTEEEKFNSFLKKLVKERKDTLNPYKGTRDTGPM